MIYKHHHLESVIMAINACKRNLAEFDHPDYNQGSVYKRLVKLYGKILNIIYR
jgi:hypothetical protein